MKTEQQFRDEAKSLADEAHTLASRIDELLKETDEDAISRHERKATKERKFGVSNIGSGFLRRALQAVENADEELIGWMEHRAIYNHELLPPAAKPA